jgi:RES domain-containing protein
VRYSGPLYRALNPLWAREPLSGHGAQTYGGRFNARGVAALYTSLSIMTALRETNQAGSFQPVTLVSYEADFERVFDSRDSAALAGIGARIEDFAAADWRDRMITDGEAPSQALARRMLEAGHDGLLVRSFAPGTGPDDLNLVLWRWGETPPARLRVVDDENRLSP